jgi:hypothetical protein
LLNDAIKDIPNPIGLKKLLSKPFKTNYVVFVQKLHWIPWQCSKSNEKAVSTPVYTQYSNGKLTAAQEG